MVLEDGWVEIADILTSILTKAMIIENGNFPDDIKEKSKELLIGTINFVEYETSEEKLGEELYKEMKSQMFGN